MKYLFIMTTSENVINFRSHLIRYLLSHGEEVTVVCNDSRKTSEINSFGVKTIVANGNNRSINPFATIAYGRKLKRIILDEKPDVVFTFQSKPNIFGVLAARKCGVKKVYSMVEGLGDPFYYTSLKWKTIRAIESFLYKRAFKHVTKVFFLNEDDKNDFVRLNMLNEGKAVLINGIGVDLAKFGDTAVDTESNSFVMAARMLKSKGVYDFCKCAEKVKKTFPNAEFIYLGSEGDVKVSDIAYYVNNCIVRYEGNVADVIPYLEKALFFILPSSYREGKPMSIMEAEAVGRGIITTINVGCKDMVIDGFNGFLVEKGNVEQLAETCKKILSDKEIAVWCGRNSRRFAERNFDSEMIDGKIYSVIREDERSV